MPEALAAGRPKWPWRLVAGFALIGGLGYGLKLLATDPLGLLFALPIWLSIYAAFAYALGRQPRRLAFWRVFALYYSVRIMMSVGDEFGYLTLYARHRPRSLIQPDVLILIGGLAMLVLLAVSLLRYARLLLGPETDTPKRYGQIFA